MLRIKKHINYFGNLSCFKMFSRQSSELSERVLSSRLRFDNARFQRAQNKFIWTVHVHRMALCAQGYEEV